MRISHGGRTNIDPSERSRTHWRPGVHKRAPGRDLLIALRAAHVETIVMTKNKHMSIKKIGTITLTTSMALAALAGCATTPSPAPPSAAAAAHWSYSGDTSPDHWGQLDPAWAACSTGQSQSPINIVTSSAAPGSGSPAELHFTATDYTIENNGHTIEIVPADASQYIMLDGTKYVFQQAHFHAPSEHTVDGQSFAMEMHLVSKTDAGAIAVIGLLITPGSENQTLKEIFANLPASQDSTQADDDQGTPTESAQDYETHTAIDLSTLIPAGSAVFRYDGSLTTPPCSEGVKWSVEETPIQLSAAQIGAFTAIYNGNARPVQPLNGRAVSLNS